MLWYATRATGIVALVLLTATVVLGVLTSVRFGTRTWPRFTLQDLHRRISLLAVVFIVLHVVTTVSDAFAPIGWLSVVVPFTSPYRRVWLGLGTAAVDLLLAVTISSLLRRKVHPRTWRTLHWLSYASWPLALAHGLGTGTDPHLGWVMLLVVGCVAAVLVAIGWRLVAGWPARAGTRVAAGATSVVAVIALAAWTATGPLRPGWALRAGTPHALLAGSQKGAPAPATAGSTPASANGASASAGSPSSVPSALPAPPFRASLAGTITQQTLSSSSVQLDIKARTSGTLDAVLDVVIVGTPDGSGGVAMQQSRASFGPPTVPAQYTGQIAGLDGSRLLLSLSNQAGTRLDLRVDVVISGSRVSGRLASVSGGGAGGGLQ
jgi:sulfoxide reductase heme-binding subunit YedZ